MKKTYGILLVLFIAAVLLVSCSSGDKSGGGGKTALTVKGFALGMSLDDAKANAQKVFSDAGIPVTFTEEKEMALDGSFQLMVMKESGQMSVMDLASDKDRRLTRFSFHPNTLDELFGMEGMDNDAVAQKVMADYNPPQLTQDDSGHWEYREVEGISIKLLIKVSNRFFTVEGHVFD